MIIVGLGNPGAAFASTYHNVGKAALQKIAERLEQEGNAIAFKKYKGFFEYASASGTALVTPLTFMNESGAAVKEALKKFGAKPASLIILHDESDLPIGKYKWSAGRGAAGHKGVRSIMEALRTNDLTRIRIGIRAANETKRKKASEFVLKKITAKDQKTLDEVFGKIADELFPKAATA